MKDLEWMRLFLFLFFVIGNFYLLFSFKPTGVTSYIKVVVGVLMFPLLFQMVSPEEKYFQSNIICSISTLGLFLFSRIAYLMVDSVLKFHETANFENINKFPISIAIKHKNIQKLALTAFFFVGIVFFFVGIWFLNGFKI